MCLNETDPATNSHSKHKTSLEQTIICYLLKRKEDIKKIKEGHKIKNFWTDCEKYVEQRGYAHKTAKSLLHRAKRVTIRSAKRLMEEFKLTMEDAILLHSTWSASF